MLCDSKWLCDLVNWKMMRCKLKRANATVLRLHTSKYYPVLQSTTKYYSALHTKTPYRNVLLCTTKYYKELLRTTKYHSVLQSTTLYYKVLQSRLLRTTKYTKCYPVLIHLIVATHETSLTMRGATHGMQNTMEL